VRRQQEKPSASFQTSEQYIDVRLALDALGAKVFTDSSSAIPDPLVEEVELVVVKALEQIVDSFLSNISQDRVLRFLGSPNMWPAI